MKIKTLHYYSGILISVFVFFHLLNHLFVLKSAESHIDWMDSFRIIYRNIFVECILLIAVLIQIISGIIQYFKIKNSIGFERLQVFSGLYMAFFFVIHVSAVMFGRYSGIDTNVFFAASGLHSFPAKLFFIPYYSLSIIAFFSHIASIHYKKTNEIISQSKAIFQAKIIIGIGVIITVWVMYGMMAIEIPNLKI